jgi:hypothetical protein
MMCIFGERMGKKNNQEVSAGIPDEGGHKRKQRQISHSAGQMRLITKHHEKNPLN